MKLRILLAALYLATCSLVATADEAAELQQMVDMLRAQGMPEEQIQQLEQQLKAMQQMEQNKNNEKAAAARRSEEQASAKRSQMAAYAQDQLNPDPGQLQVAVGEEIATLAVQSCSTAPYRTGNLHVLATVYAVGDFRGAPALIEIHKSHPYGNPEHLFHHFRVHLAELSEAEAGLPLREVLEARAEAVNAWYGSRAAEVQSQFAVTDAMSLDELNTAMKAQNTAMDELQREMDAKAIPSASSHGSAEAGDGLVQFEGQPLRFSGRGRVPDPFFDIEDFQVFAVARCP